MFDMWTLLVGKILGTYICAFPANAAISVPVPALLYNGPVICSPRNEKTLALQNIFLAVQDSSIGDIVSQSLSESDF